MKRRILAVGDEEGLLAALAEVLARSAFEVHRMASGVPAVGLCGEVKPHLVIVSHPLPDLELRDFVFSARAACSPAAPPPIVVLAESAEGTALARVDQAMRVLTPEQSRDRWEEEVLRLLEVPARSAQRLMLRLEVALGAGRLLRMCQTENISRTGMLVRSAESYPLGSEVLIEFTLPEERESIRGSAEIVRHADAAAERIQGMGLRFTRLQADGEARLEAFLEKLGIEF